jgi:hypothetical protein
MRFRHVALAGILILSSRCDDNSSPTGPGASNTPTSVVTPTQTATATPTPPACPNLSGWYERRAEYDCILFPARPETFVGQEGCTIRSAPFFFDQVTGEVQGSTITLSWRTFEGCDVLTGVGRWEPSQEMPGRFVITGTVTAPSGADQCCTRISVTLIPRNPG